MNTLKFFCYFLFVWGAIFVGDRDTKVIPLKQDGLIDSTILVINRSVSKVMPKIHYAYYVSKNDNFLRSLNNYSDDNGKTWGFKAWRLKFILDKLPNGYRRGLMTSVLDYISGRNITIYNALDIKGLNSKIAEPRISLKSYYLMYRISDNKGSNLLNFDPIIQDGYTKDNPFPGIYIGRNAVYLGDRGSIPIVTTKGTILVVAQNTVLDGSGNLFAPAGTDPFMDVLVIRGKWNKKGTIDWISSTSIPGNLQLSTRGLFEPTIVQLSSSRLLMVMRGSNGGRTDPSFKISSYKWYSISDDDGMTWTIPRPWSFDNNSLFFSPSSMSTLFRSYSGRVFWVGNISDNNCRGNLPRSKLLFAEVNRKTAKLINTNSIVIDSIGDSDRSKGSLSLLQPTIFEDRITHDLIVSYARIHGDKTYEYETIKLRIP